MSQLYRLDGIYPQRQEQYFMQRIKLAGGVISTEQAQQVADVASRFGNSAIHLTSRGSMEIHWIREEHLAEVTRHLSRVGLTSRGACGGAVRGVSSSSGIATGSAALERVARRIQRHFTANPRFERLPKKFKIAVEGDAVARRHLIQDAGLLLVDEDENGAVFDLYVAGGLGREPQPGFLLEQNVPEDRIIPLLEAIAIVYADNTPSGKRLKHLIRDIGEKQFRTLLAEQPGALEELPSITEVASTLMPGNSDNVVEVTVAAGELTSDELKIIAQFAREQSGGILVVTANQDVALPLTKLSKDEAKEQLMQLGFTTSGIIFRVCPGSHTCKMGLAATRDIAARLSATLPAGKTYAISGCPNSCTQPQLADVGIICTSLVNDAAGERTPRFDLYRASEELFGTLTAKKLTLDELCSKVQEFS